MIGFKFLIIVAILASTVVANLGDLNSIFSAQHPVKTARSNSADEALSQVCDRSGAESFQRHTVINNLDKALELGLNQSFHDRFECLQKQFDDKLVEMQHYYKMKLKENKNVSAEQVDSSSSSSAKHTKNKNKNKKNQRKNKESDELPSDLVGQTGFVFYSLNQNGTVTDFKHESFTFVQPVALGLNQTLHENDVSLLESEINAFNSDMFVLKAIQANIKKNIRARVSLLKAIKSNEKELEAELKRVQSEHSDDGEKNAKSKVERRSPRDVTAALSEKSKQAFDVNSANKVDKMKTKTKKDKVKKSSKAKKSVDKKKKRTTTD
jgi:hypothetical protein